jgi:hypothetical protein
MSGKINMVAVRKVQRLLTKGIRIPPSMGVATKKVWYDKFNDFFFALLPDRGNWMAMRHREDLADHTGIVGGYNINAMYAVDGLCLARLITKAEATEFDKWWSAQEQTNAQAIELRNLQSLASKHGYVLTKMSKKR